MAATGYHPSESASDAPWRLSDLLSRDTLQSMQDTFARAFGLPTVILDARGVEYTTISQRMRFCEDLTRTSTAGARCAGCDRCAMREAADTDRPAIFKCWNGLYDCAIPITVKGHVLGYFLCGQVLTDPFEPAAYERVAADIGADPQEYINALRDVRVLPLARYEASVESMHVLARMIADQAAASVDMLERLEEVHKARADTAQLTDELDTVLEALRDIGTQPDYEATLGSIADNLAHLIPWDSCVLYLTDDDSEELVPVVVRDPYANEVRCHRPRKGHGILGRAALGGVGKRFVDITHEPDFEPTPGVPVEPESALVMPMTYKGTLSGVIFVSRFDRRTFSDHELRILDVFASQASVSIQVSKLSSESARRLREEHAFGRLRLAMSQRTTIDEMLAEVGRVGADLLGADAAVVNAWGAVLPSTTARTAIDEGAATALLASLTSTIQSAGALHQPQTIEHHGGSALVLPLTREESHAIAVFWSRNARRTWDLRLADSLADQASLGIEKVRMHDRERRVLAQYQHLSELGAELITAGDSAEVRERLLARAPKVFSADACFIALLDQGPDAIAVELLQGAKRGQKTIALQGGARLASVRLRGEPTPDRSVFDTWSREVFAAIGPDSGLGSWLAEPIPLSAGALGGLFIGWVAPEVPVTAEERRILRVVAGATGTALGRFAASITTDSTLRNRVRELEALTQLAQHISGLTRERPIVKELLVALRRVGRLDGAVYGRATESGLQLLQSSGLARDKRADVARALADVTGVRDGTRIPLGDGRLEATLISLSGDEGQFLAGISPCVDDDQRDRVMATLARYGAVALENARLHDSQRRALSRLERQHVEISGQNTKLEQILSVHDALGLAVLEGRGLPSVVRSLAAFMNVDMLVATARERVIAAWPTDAHLDWRPKVRPGQPPRTTVDELQGGYVIAAPAMVDGMALGWIIARMQTAPTDVARAAVEYGALLTALELLRERTAIEVETQLRGGLLEELFDEGLVEDVVAKRALALGYDLSRRSRVFLVEATPAGGTSVRPPGDPDSFFGRFTRCARNWSSHNLVALRGGAVVIIVPETPDDHPDEARRFEEELRAVASARRPDDPPNIAVGTRCDAIQDYRHSYLAARRGLDLLRLLGRSGEVFSFRIESLQSVLLQATHPEVVVKFISRYVVPLERYDRTHTSNLRSSLEVYFEAGSSLQEAARRLHVHVSTLRYRLNKAADLLDVDLKDHSAMLDIQVALKADDVLTVHHR